jgi:hypothetical protein
MLTGKQPSPSSIATPKPIIVDIFHLGDIRSAREDQLIILFFGVPGVNSVNDETNSTIRWEMTERRICGRITRCV